VTSPDPEQGLKLHAKANLDPALFGGRVFFSFPEGDPPGPLLTIEQVAGGRDDYVPLEDPRLSVSVWARKKEDASKGRRALVDYLTSLEGVKLDSVTVCKSVSNVQTVYLRDPDGQYCRYIVDFTMHAAGL